MKKSWITVLHTAYWMGLVIIAFLLLTAATQGFRTGPSFEYQILLVMGFFIPSIIAFYGSYSWLFTRFLRPRKWKMLGLAGSGLVLGAALSGGLYLSAVLRWDMFFVDNIEQFFGQLLMFSVVGGLNLGTGLVLRGFISWTGEMKLREELLQKQHATELELVKAQLDPHFLFNTLNNIDVLIEKNPKQASEYLQGLSHILRFMLFEAKSTEIPLSEEVKYLQNYIDLQRIRTSNPDYVHFEVEGPIDQFQVAPMLFLPFVENAFKHAINKKEKDSIDISLRVHEHGIEFICRNKFQEGNSQQTERKGLGKELISRRLQLSYPQQYQLWVSEENGIYQVNLSLSRHAA